MLNKLEPKPNKDIVKGGISGKRWINHFKSIFQAKNTTSLPATPCDTGPPRLQNYSG